MLENLDTGTMHLCEQELTGGVDEIDVRQVNADPWFVEVANASPRVVQDE
jgi:hypothetical protein